MRFELTAAYCIGVFLPAVEVWRRWTDFTDIPAYVDDFIMGGLLLFAARSVSKRRISGPALLSAAWGVYCGAMYYSFFGQIARDTANDISGLPNELVIVVKGALFLIGLVSLILSIRIAAANVRSRENIS